MTARRKSDGVEETSFWNTNSRLIVFTKNPIVGHAKTRIAKTVGPIKALEIFEKLIRATQLICQRSNCPTSVYYSNFIDPLDAWNFAVDKCLQEQVPDLGLRLADAIHKELEQHGKIIVIGSDCPSMTTAHIDQANQLLDDHDMVVGPSTDGGFYLLGLKAMKDELFQDIEWSSASVKQTLMDNARSLRWKSTALEELNDIDEYEDWLAFVNG